MTGNEILYGKRQAPAVMRDIDKMSLEVNSKIRMRGISKGFVCVQEAYNKDALDLERAVYWASVEKDYNKRLGYLYKAIGCSKDISIVLRYMLKNKALTVGEIGNLAKCKKAVDTQLYSWVNCTKTDFEKTCKASESQQNN